MSKPTKTRLIGRYIVTDPLVCHGQPTFRGTRVLVADVLKQMASGMDWESIAEDWHGSIPTEGIKEAGDLASQALLRHADEFIVGPMTA